MKMMKHLACGAFAVALAAGISGCGSKEQTYAGPKVAEGTIAAIAARLPENTSLSSLCKQYGLGVADLMKKISDKDAQEIIKELELDKAQTKWLAVNISEVSAAKIEKGEPDFAVAIATTVDLDKAIAAGDKKKEFKKLAKKSALTDRQVRTALNHLKTTQDRSRKNCKNPAIDLQETCKRPTRGGWHTIAENLPISCPKDILHLKLFKFAEVKSGFFLQYPRASGHFRKAASQWAK